ncbi:MAG TPA: DUF692 domain-containing protein [Burkholderiaceae bacterium]|nr:DUF692 domain-containing protein [Burkholderiaceae bacterium]
MREGLVPAGVGLRQPHYTALLDSVPPLGFVEVHSENFFADGGAALAVLRRAREHYAVSLHGVGLALGSAVGLDPWHLERLALLARAIEPVRVSDHASFARAPRVPDGPIVHANDLLPIAFTEAALAVMVANVSQVQERLGRTLLVENLSAYVSFADDSMSEPEFFTQLCRRSGCGMLLDVNNLMVNALNAGVADPLAACCGFVDALPLGIVGEVHLAGYADADGLAIDDHGSRVRPAVWSVYEHALRRFGAAVPTLVEWDTDVPALDVLLGEAARATTIAARVAAA